MVEIVFLTLFPESLKASLIRGIFAKAEQNQLFSVRFIDIRETAPNKHKKVDDKPYGGGVGMILRADVLSAALGGIEQVDQYQLIYTCPKGRLFGQDDAKQLAKKKKILILSGYYEGIDERFLNLHPWQRYRVSNAVLSSGDLPSAVIAESILRQVDGVIGNTKSVKNDSIISGLAEYPQYTIPQKFEGMSVPDILTSGHHQRIKRWKKKAALRETLLKRSDLLINLSPEADDRDLLTEIIKEEAR